MTIIAIAAAALAAVFAYNKRRQQDPVAADAVVHKIRQSTSVVLAIGDALWAILDALIFLTTRRPTAATPLRQFGGRTASDEAV